MANKKNQDSKGLTLLVGLVVIIIAGVFYFGSSETKTDNIIPFSEYQSAKSCNIDYRYLEIEKADVDLISVGVVSFEDMHYDLENNQFKTVFGISSEPTMITVRVQGSIQTFYLPCADWTRVSCIGGSCGLQILKPRLECAKYPLC